MNETKTSCDITTWADSKDHLKHLQVYLEKNKDLPSEVKEQLLRLRNEYQGINDDVAIEFSSIVKLIQSGKDEIAI